MGITVILYGGQELKIQQKYVWFSLKLSVQKKKNKSMLNLKSPGDEMGEYPESLGICCISTSSRVHNFKRIEGV